MPSLLTDSEIVGITGAFGDVFDTFAKRVIIWKEPKKIISDLNLNFLYGYEDDASSSAAVTYEAVSGIYSGLMSRQGKRGDDDRHYSAGFFLPDNQVRVKVEGDARDFINSGINERLVIDDKNYNIVGKEQQIDFLTKKYFVFLLEDAS
jgi:hypothetical protein